MIFSHLVVCACREMFASAVLLAAAALMGSARASGVYFCESFDSAFGSTPPSGWHNQDLIRGSYYNFVTEDLWRFDNPGEQELTYPIKAPSAIFDSDAYSSTDNLPENVALTSPIFDTRGVNFESTSIVVDWDQYFVEGYEAKIFVEVWNGASWVEIYSETATTFNPDHQLVDITHHVAGHGHRGVEARVRFRWTGDASWFWVVDNVRVLAVDLAVNPNGCPASAPFKCETDGVCVPHESLCLLDNNCPANRPRRCLDGTCVEAGSAADDPSVCSDLVDCPADVPVRCADGSCQASAAACHTASNCPITKPQRCNDGSCAATIYDCPLTLACPDEHHPYPCRGGSCAASPEDCPKAKATELVCPCDQVQCLDLTCVDDYSQCECPCEYPYLCTETRTCVQESLFCKDTSIPRPSVVPERFGGFGAVRMVRVDECPANHFRCFDGQCVKTLTQCPDVPCSAFETANGDKLTYKCPDGSCARTREQCPPIPACDRHDPFEHTGEGRDSKRCPDGTCIASCDECAAVEECSFGRTRCPDGRCYRECPPFHGCPVDKPFECPNGNCVAAEVQCYQGCGPKEHKCYDGDECQPFSTDCRYPPSDHRAVPFSGNLNCIAIREDSLFYDVVCVADRFFDDLFATVMVPAGIFERQAEDARIDAWDVPLSEVRPLPPYPDTISHVLGVDLPDAIFDEGDFVRLTLRVELPKGFDVTDYCLAQLVEFDDGEYEWQCKDNNLVQDGVHFSGLVQNVDGVFIIMKKPGVCHNYRGFNDAQLEFIMLGRVIPRTITRLQGVYDRLIAIRKRMPEIKRSNAVLTYIAKATYQFTEDCLSTSFQKELATFPPQLLYAEAAPPAIPEPEEPECACPAEDDDDGGEDTPIKQEDDDDHDDEETPAPAPAPKPTKPHHKN